MVNDDVIVSTISRLQCLIKKKIESIKIYVFDPINIINNKFEIFTI
jgi:hypothetical protein